MARSAARYGCYGATEDAWIPVERGRELAAMIPGCELTEVPAAGHLMQKDAPEAITAAAIRFFGS